MTDRNEMTAAFSGFPATARRPIARFVADRSGSLTNMALAGTLGILMVGALAIDSANAYLVRNRLQLAADAASLAAVKALPDTDAARALAMDYVRKNLEGPEYTDLAGITDIEFGEWDGYAKSLASSANDPDAVSVVLNKRHDAGGRIAPLLLGMIGFDGFQTGARAVAVKGRISLNCSIFAFRNGTGIINSSTSITGDVCYARGVTSTTNQKAEDFFGTTIVHSQVAAFSYTDKNFFPTGGIETEDFDEALDDEEGRLMSLAASLAALPPTTVLPDPLELSGGSTITVTGLTGGTTVVDLSGFNLNGATIRLSGDSQFVFNFRKKDGTRGSFDFSDSKIELVNGAKTEKVFWNFVTAFDVMVNKDTNVFRGTILGPTSSVIYHNPADFDGMIAALDINLHSMFDFYGVPPLEGSTGETPSRLMH